jgi:hypothetical protein
VSLAGSCAPESGAKSVPQVRPVGRKPVGHLTYLAAKAKGDQSMSEKQGTLEGAYGKDALRDPRSMVKANLLEAQSPATIQASPATAPMAGPPRCRRAAPVLTLPARVSCSQVPPSGGRWAMSPFKGTNGTPVAALSFSDPENGGLPTGREPYGNGAAVVVRGRESRPHGEGRQVTLMFRARSR